MIDKIAGTLIIEGLKRIPEAVEYAEKQMILKEVAKAEKYIKELEYEVINQRKIIEAQKNVIQDLRQQLEAKK